MPYPPRPQLQPLPEFASTRDSQHPTLRRRRETYVVTAYTEGRSLREIGELVDRSQTAVRRVLDKHQILCRPVGAARQDA